MDDTRPLIGACDLHVHSRYSDGTLTPTELADIADSLGLDAIALTDHNTTRGLPELMAAADGRRPRLIPGVELSTSYRTRELHLIALGVMPEHYEKIEALVCQMMERKHKSTYQLIDDLISAGYKIDRKRIEEGALGQINRAHIALELVRCGYVKTRGEAFDTLLAKDGGFYKEPERIGTLEAITLVKSIGAVAVLAHPLLNVTEQELRELLPHAVSAGLDAIEVIYPEYTPEEEQLMQSIADEFGLMYSGGSDFHGKNKPDISLGTGKGTLRVPTELAQRLGLMN